MPADLRSRTAASARGRLWVVIVLARPRGAGHGLRELSRALSEQGARRVSAGVYLAPDAEGLGERLASIAGRIRVAGGRVIVADSRVVESRAARGGADER